MVAGLREPRTTIGGVNLVVGFRPELWARVAPDANPAGTTAATTTAGDWRTAPPTRRSAPAWPSFSGWAG